MKPGCALMMSFATLINEAKPPPFLISERSERLHFSSAKRLHSPARGGFIKKARRSVLFSGSPCWARTNDPAVNSRMLYQLSSGGIICRRHLFSRAVTSQVSWATVSLTSVFGMGTGGTSKQSTPAYIWQTREALYPCEMGRWAAVSRCGDPCEIRTRVAGVRGRSLRPLDQRAKLSESAWRVAPGTPPGTRTLGPLIKSQLLYQLS